MKKFEVGQKIKYGSCTYEVKGIDIHGGYKEDIKILKLIRHGKKDQPLSRRFETDKSGGEYVVLRDKGESYNWNRAIIEAAILTPGN